MNPGGDGSLHAGPVASPGTGAPSGHALATATDCGDECLGSERQGSELFVDGASGRLRPAAPLSSQLLTSLLPGHVQTGAARRSQVAGAAWEAGARPPRLLEGCPV